ncbi:MAG: hypothetical protein Q4A78_08085 [Peptostreptococcaceae bacterium]|nr:hypothetical protein [Peptostreptococcaceae bacterium]
MSKAKKTRLRAVVLIDIVAAVSILLIFVIPAARIGYASQLLLTKAERLGRMSRLMQDTARGLTGGDIPAEDREILEGEDRLRIRIDCRPSDHEEIVVVYIRVEDEEGESCETEVFLRR